MASKTGLPWQHVILNAKFFKNLQYILAKVILFGRYHLNIKEVLPPRPNRDKPITFSFSFIPDIGDRSVFVNWGGPEKFKGGGCH